MIRKTTLTLLALLTLCLLAFACGAGRDEILVFTSEDETRHVYLYKGDENPEPITNGPSDNHSPRLSPDGELIAFVSDRDGNADIYIMNRSGENITLISDGEGTASHPRWSPDGRQIAYLLQDASGAPHVYLSDAEEPRAQRLTTGDFSEGPPAWSPDGRWIAFSLSDSDGEGQGIVLRNPGGVNQITLTEGPDFNPSWSPESDSIVFQSSRNGDLDIYVIDVLEDFTGQPRRITTNSAPDYNPVWSPDGDQIAFISERDENPEIYVTIPDGTVVERLTNNRTVEAEIIWSPKGQIAFVSYLHDNADIFIMDSDGTAQAQATSASGPDTQPHW